MKSNMKRIAALVMAVVLVLSMVPGAMAAEYYSGSLSVGGRVKKPTPAPTEAPVEETPAPVLPEEPVVEEPTEEPVIEAPVVEPSEEPVIEEPVTEPSEEPVIEEPAAEPTEEPVIEEPVIEEPVIEEPVEEEVPETVFAVVYKTGEDQTAMIRAEANSESERVGKAYHGDVVIVLGEENGWYNVDANGIIGWISGKLLSFDLDAIEAPEAEVEEEVVEEPVEEEPVIEETETEATPDEVVEEPVEEAAEEPTAGPEIDVSKLSVEIFSTMGDIVLPGDTITLTSKLTGFDGLTYTLQWQCDNGSGWADVPGATDGSYSFTADETNINAQWRLEVSL